MREITVGAAAAAMPDAEQQLGGTMQSEDGRLDAAVQQGIITDAQAAAIRALPIPSAAPAGGIARAMSGGPAREMFPVFSAAMLAYVLGAATVVIAMAWFLADRWTWLGAGGVLAAAVLYTALFLFVARRLRHEGSETAAGFAVLLAVAMAPVAAIAALELAGGAGAPLGASCRAPYFLFWACRGEEIVAELALALAALFALRRVRFSLLVLPLAAVAVRLIMHATFALGRGHLGDAVQGWTWVMGASVLAATAYAVDRRQRGDVDFARWLHLTAAFAGFVATLHLTFAYEWYRHLMVPGAFVAFAASLILRRVPWLLLGMGWFVWYLGWLASDVFRETPVFPIILAALGIGMIVATVWVQRNAAMLVARFGVVTDDGRPRFPGGVVLLLAPAIVALLMLEEGRQRDRARRPADPPPSVETTRQPGA